MTLWEEIEIHAMQYIKNDISLERDMRSRLPVFYNRMAGYMRMAIPRFNRPPKMLLRLSKFTAPQFASETRETSEEISEGHTFENLPQGYDIASAGKIELDEYGSDPVYIPLPASYDTESGTVTVNAPVGQGARLVFDFYKSGCFGTNLNMTEKDILAFCVYNAWEHRFDNNALARTPKERDSTFTTISEASDTQANTARMKLADAQMFSMLRAYEENLAVLKTVNGVNLI